MGIVVNLDPYDVTVGDTIIYLKHDPTATKAWDTLLEIETDYTDPKKRDEAIAHLLQAFADLSHTPEDAMLWSGLDHETVGLATLRLIAEDYIHDVTGFPTVPQSPSRKR